MLMFGPLRIMSGRVAKFDDRNMWVYLSDDELNMLDGGVL
jgi:hypothetical protein